MQKIVDAIARSARDSAFTGAVSISIDGESIYKGAYGERDRSNQLPNTVETRFAIASGSKLLTALAIGVLVDRGDLTVTTEVGELHEDFHTFIDPSATVAQLLSHTSGAYDYYDEDIITDFDDFFVDIPWYQLGTPTDYLPLFVDQKMKYAPGDHFSYSNGGYILLGILLETLSGQRYRAFVEDNVLRRAGMLRSGFFAFNDLPENTAHGYLGDGNQTNIYNLPIRGASDGGVYTTLDDLDRLWTSFMAEELVSPAFTQQMLSPQVTFDDGGGYGYGVYWTVTQRGNDMHYIVGADAGVGFDSAYFPAQRTIISILSNTSDGEEEMRNAIYAELEL